MSQWKQNGRMAVIYFAHLKPLATYFLKSETKQPNKENKKENLILEMW